MEPTKNIYPVFEANQVLTNEHLNQGFEYLDEQERLTRANLTGIGIVCGLEISFSESSVIKITQGRGITSEGYLVVLPADQPLGYYKKYDLPKDLEYEKFLKTDRTQFDLWEITTDSKNSTSLPPLTDSFWQGTKEKVVLLFVELIKEDLKDCTPNNCNDKGAKVTATIRPLLIEKNNPLFNDINNTSTVAPAIELCAVRLPRPKKFNGENIISKYTEKLNEFLVTTNPQYINFVNVYKKYNDRYHLDLSDPFSSVFQSLLSNPNNVFIQYYYDFLLDVIQAYNELICFTDRNPVCACVPDPHVNTFPRHLMLGSKFDGTHDKYRFAFTPSKALIDQRDEARSEEKLLYQRLVEITKKFQPAELDQYINNGIKITPSQYGDFPLAHKAIPCYYDISSSFENFSKLWTTGKRCSGLAVETNSYHSNNPNPPPLNYHLEAYNFFRIEGHIGKTNPNIQGMITDENLPFSVLSVNSSDFKVFADKHPGLTHGAGVPTGGTFIMVSDGGDGGKVIADFFLPYRVFEVSELSEVCEVCKQKEIPKICLIVGSILIILLMYFMGIKPPINNRDRDIIKKTDISSETMKSNDVQHWEKQ